MSTRMRQRHVPKTADYTIKPPMDSAGTIFTNRDASGTVIFTLPAPGLQMLGEWYEFHGIADQTLTVAAATAGDIVTKNDAAANSVSAQTAGEKIGAKLKAICVESAAGVYKWAVSGLAVGHTYTVAT